MERERVQIEAHLGLIGIRAHQREREWAVVVDLVRASFGSELESNLASKNGLDDTKMEAVRHDTRY